MQNYWQGSYAPQASRFTPVVKVLMLSTVGAFFVQLVLALFGVNLALFFGLSLSGLRYGMIWQPVTYLFMHGSPLHLIFNMLALFFFGPEMERTLGTRPFCWLYFGAGIVGGIGWLLISGTSQAVCVGASGAILGVLAAFATLFPHRQITLLLFFVLPVTMKAWVMVVGFAVVDLMILLGGGGQVANAAHLAGGLAGYLYVRYFTQRSPGLPRPRRRRPPTFTVLPGKDTTSPPTRDEVDRVLEKIARQGMNSLTPAERRTLEQASETLRNRGR